MNMNDNSIHTIIINKWKTNTKQTKQTNKKQSKQTNKTKQTNKQIIWNKEQVNFSFKNETGRNMELFPTLLSNNVCKDYS